MNSSGSFCPRLKDGSRKDVRKKLDIAARCGVKGMPAHPFFCCEKAELTASWQHMARLQMERETAIILLQFAKMVA
ncbi:hypothetical protein CHK_0737 [Christensenella hongkongensis]|uniref:Uncharacterized protein n=1 Tax=Christensenella hongkongensis TaxID=270498 RepID=A0A0M2NKT9_9FIRM|nr:hypothetical protein CHK_0737 [Christensenella hongkongensis]